LPQRNSSSQKLSRSKSGRKDTRSEEVAKSPERGERGGNGSRKKKHGEHRDTWTGSIEW